MDSCHKSFFYSKFVIQHFSHRGKAVGGARCITVGWKYKKRKELIPEAKFVAYWLGKTNSQEANCQIQ